MKALQVTEVGLVLSDVDAPTANGEVLVRVLKSGICNTDIEIGRGYAGFRGTIGHEFVGIVEDGPATLVGERVVGEINAGCGKCGLCLSGDPRHCENRTVLGIHGRDGAHAEYLTLPSANLLKVPESVTNDSAVFVEPLAAAYGISEQVDLGPAQRIAVIGDGKLGTLCARGLWRIAGGLTLIGKHRSKLERAASGCEIETVLLDQTAGMRRSFDIVIEASGSSTGFETALDLLLPRGTLVLKSTFHGRTEWDASRVVVDEITIVGSRCGRFGPALELLAKGEVRVDDLISEEFSLDDGVEAMRTAAKPGVMKVLLRP